MTTLRPQLIEPIKGSNEGVAITVMGLPWSISTIAIERVHRNGAVSYVESGNAFAHTLVVHDGRVMELVLGNEVSMRLAKHLKGQIKNSAPAAVPPTTTSPVPTQATMPPTRRPLRWVETTLSGPVLAPLGSKVYRLPVDAVFRYNGKRGHRGLLYVLVPSEGLVHLLSTQGEAVLEPGEAKRLASRWEHLVIGDS